MKNDPDFVQIKLTFPLLYGLFSRCCMAGVFTADAALIWLQAVASCSVSGHGREVEEGCQTSHWAALGKKSMWNLFRYNFPVVTVPLKKLITLSETMSVSVLLGFVFVAMRRFCLFLHESWSRCFVFIAFESSGRQSQIWESACADFVSTERPHTHTGLSDKDYIQCSAMMYLLGTSRLLVFTINCGIKHYN